MHVVCLRSHFVECAEVCQLEFTLFLLVIAMSWLFESKEQKTQAGKQLSDLGYEIITFVGLKLLCTLNGLRGQDYLPRNFVVGVFRLARRRAPKKITEYSVNSFCQDFLPIRSQRVWDMLKCWNSIYYPSNCPTRMCRCKHWNNYTINQQTSETKIA